MFRSRRPQVRVPGVPSGVVQWICVVPRNHHDENRTMSHSAGAGPEPPQGAGDPVYFNAFDYNVCRLTPDCELYNKRVLLIVP